MKILYAQRLKKLRPIFFVMRITFLLLLCSILTVSAATNAQQITLKTSNAKLEDVLDKVRQETGYDVFYSNDLLTKAKPVTVDLKAVPLAEAMATILTGQPLTFHIDDQTVVIKEKETSVLQEIKDKVKDLIQNINVHGKVVGDDGQPLPGATVIVMGTNNSTITDAKGEFNLKNIDPEQVIAVTFVGYQRYVGKPLAEMGIIKMIAASNPLDQVQVIAYGDQTQRLSVGNVTTITSKTISEQPVSNPILALEGQVAGLSITQNSGLPGSSVTVHVQGFNNYTGNASDNDPYYVVDGVPYSSTVLTGNLSVLSFGENPSALSLINPDDIESISVLKGADATAIYGTRAANGAILITTKKGKAGETRIDMNLQQGIGQVPHFLDLLTTQQYLQMRHQALANDGVTPSSTDYDLNGLWDTTRYTNWQKTLIGGTNHFSDFNGSVSGGSNNIQYLVSGTYHRETTVFPMDASDRKSGLHFNLSSTSENKKFKMSLTGSYLYDDNKLPLYDLTSAAVTLAPNAPQLYNADGSVNWDLDANGNPSFSANPAAVLLTSYQVKTNNLVSNLNLSYELINGLVLSSSFGYTDMFANELREDPQSAIPPNVRRFIPNNSDFSTSNMNTWIIEPQLNYTRAIGKGKLSVLLGATAEESNSDLQQIHAYGFSSELQLGDIAAAPNLQVVQAGNVTYKYNAAFARLNYIWDQKYIIDLNARRDGSSRFGPANEFNDFWSVGGGWVFSEEKFIKANLPFLSFGKIRSSYGSAGSDQVGDYQYLSLYGSVTPGIPYQGISTLAPQGLPNPYLQWQTTRKFEVGTDLGFLNDHILLNVTYARNRSSNLLLESPLPETTGASLIQENLPAVVGNNEWEFTLNTVNVKTKNFTWRSSVNLTLPRNELIKYPDLAASVNAGRLAIGQPIYGLVKVFHYLGVDPNTGLYQFAGANGPTSNPDYSTDQNKFINTNPTAYGGFYNSFTYKSFQLDFMLQFVRQNGQKLNYGFFNLPPGTALSNEPVTVLNNPWTTVGQKASIQRYDSDYNYYTSLNDLQQSDAYYGNDSYLKLKNISFSWTAPVNWLTGMDIKKLQFYSQAENVLTITGYKGFDPETQTSYSLPALRVITFGIKAGF